MWLWSSFLIQGSGFSDPIHFTVTFHTCAVRLSDTCFTVYILSRQVWRRTAAIREKNRRYQRNIQLKCSFMSYFEVRIASVLSCTFFSVPSTQLKFGSLEHMVAIATRHFSLFLASSTDLESVLPLSCFTKELVKKQTRQVKRWWKMKNYVCSHVRLVYISYLVI